MIGKQTFSERLGRGFRRDPFLYLPMQLAPLVLMGLAYLIFTAGLGEPLTLILAALLLFAFLTWIALVLRWSQQQYLARKGAQRRRAASRSAE